MDVAAAAAAALDGAVLNGMPPSPIVADLTKDVTKDVTRDVAAGRSAAAAASATGAAEKATAAVPPARGEDPRGSGTYPI